MIESEIMHAVCNRTVRSYPIYQIRSSQLHEAQPILLQLTFSQSGMSRSFRVT